MTTLTLEDVNLADPGKFVPVPHEMFDVLRREAPVWDHPATPRASGAS